MRLLTLSATLIFGVSAFAAVAQTPSPPPPMPTSQADMIAMMHRAAHNQLGILEYCEAQGSVGADTVAVQQRVLGMLPPATVDGLDEAEALGKRGVVSIAGNQVPIADAAKRQSMTPDAMCKQLAVKLNSQAAELLK